MRRVIFLVLGLLECAAAALFVSLGWQIPSSEQVDGGRDALLRITDRAGTQARLLRQQIQELRRLELQELGDHLTAQTRHLIALLKAPSVDFDTVGRLRDALTDMSVGLNDLVETLHQSGIGKRAEGQLAVRWDQVQKALSGSSTVLRTTSRQLDQVLQHRGDFDATLRQTLLVADAFATVLPALTDHLDSQLYEEDRVLEELNQSLAEVAELAPPYGASLSRFLGTARWLAWLLGAIAALHGGYLVATTLPARSAAAATRGSAGLRPGTAAGATGCL